MHTERQFAIDPQYARENVLQMRRGKGKYGIKLEFEAKFESKVIYSEQQIELPGGETVTRICIDAPDRRWVK
jgi:hypothetical protein